LGKLRRVKRWEGGEGKEKGQGIKGGKKRVGRKVLPKKNIYHYTTAFIEMSNECRPCN